MNNQKLRIVLICITAMLISFLSVTFIQNSAMAAVKSGSRGEEVKQVQKRLKELGLYDGAVDGIAGNKTVSAIKTFQRNNGLKEDGIVGPATAQAMGIENQSPVGNNDLYLLARAIYSESRGEPYEGQIAVGAVILNRVKSPLFPNTISGVIYQPQAFAVVADGQINMAPDETAIRAAREALNGADPTGGCLYYYNPSTAQSQWIFSRDVTLSIGNHNFAL